MTLSGLWTRKSSSKESKPPHSPPSDVRKSPWTQLKSKLRSRRGHETADHPTSPDARVSAKTTTHRRKRELLLQTISPRPSVHPPRSSTTSSPSRDNTVAPTSPVYLGSDRHLPQPSPFAMPYECEHLSFAPNRAQTFGVVPSTDCHARDLGFEENVGERVDARSSQQFPTVPSANTEITPLSDLGPASAPESSNASPLYGYELANEYLSAASICQARRWRLRAQINRARLIAVDLADSDLTLQNHNVLDLAILAEAEPVALDGHESASGSFESADAPAPSDIGLNEASSESVEYIAPAEVQVPTQPPELHESADIETMNFHPTSRDSVASSSSYYSLFEYDDVVSDHPRDAENAPPPLNPAEDTDVDSERSLYDPVLQCFFLPPKVNEIDSATNYARNIDKEGIESAGVKAESFNADAPVPSTRVSGSELCKLVIRVTAPTPPVTMRPTDLQRNQPIHDGEVDLQNYLVPPNPRRSQSRANSDHLGFDFGATDVLAAAPSAEKYSNFGSGGVTARVRSDTRFTSRHLRTIQTFGSSATLVDQLPPPANINILRRSALAGDYFHVVDGEDMSAGDEAEPSSFDAPIPSTPVPRRKPKKPKGFAGRLSSSRLHQKARILTASFREWGNPALRLFTGQGPANVEETPTFHPFFDPWEEGYIPPRGPSPE